MEKKTKGLDEIYCRSCGEIIKKEAEICPHCGVRNSYSIINSKNIQKGSNYDILLPLLYISGLICYLSARYSSNIIVAAFFSMIFVAIFIASIIIVYSDANNLGASNSEKWVIVISVLMLWIFILPVYIFKRKSLQNYEANETAESPIPTENVSIICPMLKSKKISESDWRNALSGLTNAEETTKEIDMPASTLFDVISDVLQDINLFMLPPKVNDSGNFYRAISKFYAEGIKELRYAAQIEVVGGSSKSKLILKAWAESEDALTGFYHGILDEIEKRIQVKELIDNNIVYNYHYGDKIGTQITDSLVQRSFNTETKAEAASTSVNISSQNAEEIRISNDNPLPINVKESSNAPTSIDFQKELVSTLDIAEREGKEYLDVTSGDLHRVVGNYPGTNHRMPVCCSIMKKMMGSDDEILQQPPSGYGASLIIRYRLPRK